MTRRSLLAVGFVSAAVACAPRTWRPASLDAVHEGAAGCYALSDSTGRLRVAGYPLIIVLDTTPVPWRWPVELRDAPDRRAGTPQQDLSKTPDASKRPVFTWKQHADTLLIIEQGVMWGFFIRAVIDSIGFNGALYFSDDVVVKQRQGSVGGRRIACTGAAQGRRAT